MKSKKTIHTLIVTTIVFFGLLLGNQMFASTPDFASPDGKEVKKEQAKAKTDKQAAKQISVKQEKNDSQPIDNAEVNKEEEYVDPNNPHNNFDCSKAGFDRE